MKANGPLNEVPAEVASGLTDDLEADVVPAEGDVSNCQGMLTRLDSPGLPRHLAAVVHVFERLRERVEVEDALV